MTSISQFNLSKTGLLYNNDFTSTDGTTKYTGTDPLTFTLNPGSVGSASFLKDYPATNPSSGWSIAYVAGATDCNTYTNAYSYYTASPPAGPQQTGLIVRGNGTNTFYYAYFDLASTPTFILGKCIAGTFTTLTSASPTITQNTFYQLSLTVKGSTLTATITISGAVTTLTTTDSSITTGVNVGFFSSLNRPSSTSYSYDEFDYLTAVTSSIVTVKGLLDGQKFKVYRAGQLIGVSGASVGQVATLTVSSVSTLPGDGLNAGFDQIIVTDVDGVTVIYTFNNTGGIWPGDTYTAAAANTLLVNPPFINPLKTQRPRLAFYTKNKVYDNIIIADVSPPSGNQLGSFRFVIPDLGLTEAKNFVGFDDVRVISKSGGKTGHVMRGIADRPNPLRLPSGYYALEVNGRDLGGYLDLRRYATQITFSATEISQVIKDPLNGPGPLCPELNFGNYILNTGVTLADYTIPRGMSCMDLLRELAALATTPTTQWAVWTDQGEYPGDNGVPNVHFGPIKQSVGLIPVNTLNSYSTSAPLDYRQIITRLILGYDSGSGGVLPNAYLTVDGFGPGINSLWSASFNGTSSYVSIPASGPLNLNSTIAAEFWVYPSSVAGLQTIICKGRPNADQNNSNYGIRLNGTNIDFYYTSAGTAALNNVYTTSGTNLATNTWYYVIVQYVFGRPNTMQIWVGTNQSNTVSGSQTVVVNGTAAAGATTININSFVANYNYAIGTAVEGAFTTLTSSLTSGTAYTSLSVAALPSQVTNGAILTLEAPLSISGIQYAYPNQMYLQNGSWTTGTGGSLPQINPYPLTSGAVTVDGIAAELFGGGNAGARLDNVRIWNRQLTQTEILQHYQGINKDGVTYPYLTGYPILELLFEEPATYNNPSYGGPNILDTSGYLNNGTSSNLTYFNYNGIPNSEAQYGIIARYFDRSYSGQVEATNFGNAILRIYRQPQRFVQVSIPLDMRFTPGQYINVIDRSFRGRALLKEVQHIWNDLPNTTLTLLYL